MPTIDWGTIDPHVHCRDEEWRNKTTIAGTLALAEQMGIGVICDMPNVARPVTDRKRVSERLALVPKGQEWRYRLYVGLTDDQAQIDEAVWCWGNIPEVIGFKLFAGKSVGDLSVARYDKQRLVFERLTKMGFTGVLAVHCEKESLLSSELFVPSMPISHGLARPMIAEEESVKEIIQMSRRCGFPGHLQICHVSTACAAWKVNEAKQAGMRISCEVTPHHIMWNEEEMNRPDGLLHKMNPPLRPETDRAALIQMLLDGHIDCIGTDHAPHTIVEKAPPHCLSGYPSMNIYGTFVGDFLPRLGLSQEQIIALTRDNIMQIFGQKLDYLRP